MDSPNFVCNVFQKGCGRQKVRSHLQGQKPPLTKKDYRKNEVDEFNPKIFDIYVTWVDKNEYEVRLLK